MKGVPRLAAHGGWIAVDLDRTLAIYDGTWRGPYHIGAPVPVMVARVKRWLAAGIDVRVFTARATPGADGQVDRAVVFAIELWCQQHIGQKLRVTNQKDYEMIEVWDDRAIGVVPNTGERTDGEPEECCFDASCSDCNPKPCDHDALKPQAPIQCGECGVIVQG